MSKAENEVLAKIQRLLFLKKETPILLLAIAGILFVSLFYGIKALQTEANCRTVVDAYSRSLQELSAISSEAESTWKSLPIYDKEIFGDARVSDRQIYSSFGDFFSSNYKSESDKELRIGSRIISNNPQCFDSREVAEAQDYLSDF